MEISGDALINDLNAVQLGSAHIIQAGNEIARNTVETHSPQVERMIGLARDRLEMQSGTQVVRVTDETLDTLISTHT